MLLLELLYVILKVILDHLQHFFVVARWMYEFFFDDFHEVFWPKILTKKLPEDFWANYFWFLRDVSLTKLSHILTLNSFDFAQKFNKALRIQFAKLDSIFVKMLEQTNFLKQVIGVNWKSLDLAEEKVSYLGDLGVHNFDHLWLQAVCNIEKTGLDLVFD